MPSTVAYLDSKTRTLDVIPADQGGRPIRSFRDVRNEAHARTLLSRAGFTVTGSEPYPYGVGLSVTRS